MNNLHTTTIMIFYYCADQFSVLVYSDLVTGLYFAYYLSDMMLNFLVLLLLFYDLVEM